MSAATSVAWELGRALAGVALIPPRFLGFLARRGRRLREVRADLDDPAELSAPPRLPPLPRRPLRVFVSCAEPSGEIHACNLVRALRARLAELGAPPPSVRGLGGERLASLGVARAGDPVSRARMGLGGWTAQLPFYLRLLRDAVRDLERERPDVFVPVDSPALHVPLARMARGRGIPVVHFVAPQYWGWAPWRVRAYARAVDLALTILPFEPRWFQREGVRTAHVGHPLLDELPERDGSAPPPHGPLALLPGSRAGIIDRNLPWMLRTLALLQARRPGTEVVLAHARPEVRERLAEHVRRVGSPSWLRLEEASLDDVLGRASAAFSVSGTVLVDVLHRRLPTVVVYRVAGARDTWLYRHALAVPWFSSPNLLAGREVLPEFCFHGEGPRSAVVAALERAVGDPAWRADTVAGLDEAARRLGPPGAAARAAEHSLAVAAGAAAGAAR